MDESATTSGHSANLRFLAVGVRIKSVIKRMFEKYVFYPIWVRASSAEE